TVAAAKGYYVRALARDLGTSLGVPAHLSALRRTASGAFSLDQAVSLEALSDAHLMAVADAAVRVLPPVPLSPPGVDRARCGGPMRPEDFLAPVPPGVPSAWLGPDGVLVAVGEGPPDGGDGAPRVRRGFAVPPLDPP
ncbi:MAG: tRNA pseudouridine(55) synthase TruB, partial [Myxococcota bacterium]